MARQKNLFDLRISNGSVREGAIYRFVASFFDPYTKVLSGKVVITRGSTDAVHRWKMADDGTVTPEELSPFAVKTLRAMKEVVDLACEHDE